MNDVKTLGNDIRDADNLPSKKYDDQAWQTLAPGHRAIDVFLHELNIYSVSPVAMFDVARVWPVTEGVRYGVGPGLRLSLVNANFTLGYGFNPQRSDRESIGRSFLSWTSLVCFSQSRFRVDCVRAWRRNRGADGQLGSSAPYLTYKSRETP